MEEKEIIFQADDVFWYKIHLYKFPQSDTIYSISIWQDTDNDGEPIRIYYQEFNLRNRDTGAFGRIKDVSSIKDKISLISQRIKSDVVDNALFESDRYKPHIPIIVNKIHEFFVEIIKKNGEESN